MFGLLKNKLASFIKGLAGKEESKDSQAPAEPPEGKKPEIVGEKIDEPRPELKKEEPKPEIKAKPAPKPAEKEPEPTPKPVPVEAKPVEAKMTEEKKPEPKKPEVAPKLEPIVIPGEAPQKKEGKKSIIDAIFKKPVPKPVPQEKASAPEEKQPERDMSRLEKRAASGKKETAPKIGIGTAIKSFFSNEITIGEAEVSDLLSELELSLLEADVAYDVSLDVTSQLRGRLVGMKVPKGKVEEKTREAIEGVLTTVMSSDRKFDLVERVRALEKPAKILFVGPNGAGKTTTMAKIARMLLDNGFTAVFSASDTFRAAAIEQTEVHAGRLGVRVVKSKYGADPASVAFDAVNFARTHNIDVVLIDSAGRQDTNANLLDELKKISRVAKPDVKIYIGESIGGNALIDQVHAFDKAIGIDGAILTKIDCDAKGGTALSLTKSTGIPVLYLGIGQAYTDLVPFEPEKIAHEIMS